MTSGDRNTPRGGRHITAAEAVRYHEPFGWWGPVWTPPEPRSLFDLLTAGTLDAASAGLLWALLARRASIIVAAEPSGAGKTTLLTALLDLVPAGVERLYLRGCFETFAYLDDPGIDPNRSILLVNEISANLPIYLWGPGVKRVFASLQRGFSLAATLHASRVEEIVHLLTGYPLHVPPGAIGQVPVIVLLDAWSDGETVHRQVSAIVSLRRASAQVLSVTTLVDRSIRGGVLGLHLDEIAHTLAELTPCSNDPLAEIRDRAAVISALAIDPLAPDEVKSVLTRHGGAWPHWEPMAPVGYHAPEPG